MTTDDPRTRAREVAESLYGPPREDEWMRTTVERGAWAAGWENGYLAHAAQQPSLPHRDELAAVILDATVPFRGPGGQTVPYVMPVHYAMADAVLALLDGPVS